MPPLGWRRMAPAMYRAVSPAQFAQNPRHVLTHRELFAGDAMMCHDLSARDDGEPRLAQILGPYLRQTLRDRVFDPHLDCLKIAAQLRHLV